MGLKIEGFEDDEVFEQGEDAGNFENDGDDDSDNNVVAQEDLREKEAEKRRREAEMIYGSDDEVGGMLAEAWGDFQKEAEYYTVTKMTSGVKDQNRVNIFLDGHFAFSLDVTQVIEFGLKVRTKVTPEKLEELRRASEFGKLYQRTLEWAMSRPHSVRETRDYLKRRQLKRKQLNRQREKDQLKPLPEIDSEVAELVVRRLIEKRYLDDQKFAEYYVENRYQRKGISQKRLRMEMRNKGVDSGVIEAALEKIPRDEDEEIAKVIAKKRRKYDDFKLVNYLVRQGFSFQKAKEAVENWQEDE